MGTPQRSTGMPLAIIANALAVSRGLGLTALPVVAQHEEAMMPVSSLKLMIAFGFAGGLLSASALTAQIRRTEPPVIPRVIPRVMPEVGPTNTITVAVLGGGSVNYPGGVCAPKPGTTSNICTFKVPANTLFALSPKPDAGKTFERWEGINPQLDSYCLTRTKCELNGNRSHSLVARFRPFAHRLWVKPFSGKIEAVYGFFDKGTADLRGGDVYWVAPGAEIKVTVLLDAWQSLGAGCDDLKWGPAGVKKPNDPFGGSWATYEVCKVKMNADREVGQPESGSSIKQPKLPQLPGWK